MIEVANVSKSFPLNAKQQKELGTKQDSFLAVDDISFECKPGKVFSLLGPNGAGKTTLLRLLSTVFKPTSGDIKIEGVSVLKNAAEVRSKIGFLTGSTNLYDRLTPTEIVQYFAALHGMDATKIKQQKDILFDQLKIHEFAHKRIGALSTGMKQRVSIARSMIHNPSVVIFDEPTSGLDVITAHSIVDLIRQCKQENKTVIFSSHIMSEVELLCDDLAIISKGKLVFNNTLKNFQEQHQGKSLTEAFIEVVMASSAY